MVTLLEKLFLENKKLNAGELRQRYGVICGSLGIFLNIILFVGKFIAGTISSSIAITADAFNNLSDAGSSAVTLIGFKLAGAKPDPSHPFGHGRMEYISGFVVAASILIMAFELLKNSAAKILHPSPVEFSMLSVLILAVAIAVKAYMAYYNRRIGTKIDSAAMRATSMDSLSDMIATSVVLAATLVGHYTGLNIDGFCGVMVSFFIFYAGISAARETLNPLLGQPPEKDFVDEIEQIVMAHEGVYGIHDLIVHDYGPGRQMITLHAEVPAQGNILELHDEIDLIEMELKEKLGCMATIHMDPIVTDDKETADLKNDLKAILEKLDEHISMHDFRMVAGPSHTNLIFDVVVPYELKMSEKEVINKIQELVKKELGRNYYTVINVDKTYVM
ncbi:MAG: cation diffusion facilitator family transporter [Lachnospiraceae bacterium]|nr:cation diffusion facilitator family transporter [Lachnospiraceae bacterium]